MKKFNNVGSIQKFYSIVITLAIISILVFAVPVQALDVKLSPASSPKVMAGQDVTFTAGLNIKAKELVPLDELSIKIGDQTCRFNIDGTPIEGCDDITIELKKMSTYMIGDKEFKFKGHKYQYDYGYGYGPEHASGSAEFEYEIRYRAHSNGKYEAVLSAHVGDDSFSSVTHKFEVGKKK